MKTTITIVSLGQELGERAIFKCGDRASINPYAEIEFKVEEEGKKTVTHYTVLSLSCPQIDQLEHESVLAVRDFRAINTATVSALYCQREELLSRIERAQGELTAVNLELNRREAGRIKSKVVLDNPPEVR